MQDLAKEIMSNLKLKDRPSRLAIVANGRDYQNAQDSFHTPKYRHILRVTAPIEDGILLFRVSYYDNHDSNNHNLKWEDLDYSYDDIDGVVAFVDGFMASGCRSSNIEVFDKQRLVGRISLENRMDEASTRITQIRGAIKSLCTK
mmetsp:Transcript_17434/g.21296  ORF Transcript_17434/g.21296 Transcript_17434/m.21296 type:complete len:145 (-) Transcript_17434:217-651(-)